MKILGGAYLIWLAWKFWTAQAGLVRAREGRRMTGGRAFLAGFTVTLGNPKTIIFYMAILPSVLDLRQVHPGQWALLSVLTALVLFAVLSPYAVLAASARNLMKSSSALHRINRAAAGIIGAAGVLILGQAAQALMRRA